MEHYLLILAIANLISEQSIVRNQINKLFGSENYLTWNSNKRFFYDLLSCPPCLSFHVGLIYSLLCNINFVGSVQIGLISMFIYAVIEKLKR